MRTLEMLSHLDAARMDDASNVGEAIDRVAVRQIKGALREHLDRARWHEKQATQLEVELATLLAKNGWVDSVDAEGEEGE